jgi:hypothetical protein
MKKRSSGMPSNVERALGRYQNNREAIAKWAAVTAIVWSTVILAMSMSAPLIPMAVKMSMPPVLIGAVAWGTARSVKARKPALYGMAAVWFCLIVVFVSQVQYYSLLSNAKIVKPSTQTEQTR